MNIMHETRIIEVEKDLTSIKNSLDKLVHALDGFHDFKVRTYTHLDDGERPGGTRDRIKDLELSCSHMKGTIKTLQDSYWKSSLIGGMVGGLIAIATPQTFQAVARLLGILK